MLRWRLLLGALLVGAVVALCWLDANASTPGMWLLPLALVLSVLCSHEMVRLLTAAGARPAAWVVYAGNLAMVAANWITVFWPGTPVRAFECVMLALALGVLAAFFVEMRRYRSPGGATQGVALTILALAYVGLLLSFVCQLRLQGPGGLGIGSLASLIIVVKLSDVGAYTVGRLFGRHKLAPRLSPGKTVEGAIGGLAAACVGAYLALEWIVPKLAGAKYESRLAWGWIVFGLLVGTAGILGDLAESLMKRDLGRKDSSDWMPGFGGVLDVLDSILLAAPVAYACWSLGIAGP